MREFSRPSQSSVVLLNAPSQWPLSDKIMSDLPYWHKGKKQYCLVIKSIR
jgi:hypothetical protein